MTSKSPLASDANVQPFLAATFDPADYLNSRLPAWSTKSNASPSLAEAASQTQILNSQLNAQLARLSTSLTSLTDDILCSGGRLAYDVELLRSETSTLVDLLTVGLREDVEKFLPDGLDVHHPIDQEQLPPGNPERLGNEPGANGDQAGNVAKPKPAPLPNFIQRLQALTVVRQRLDSVVKTFGEAIDWVIPPSEVQKSAFISVSGPSAADTEAQEKKGREYAENLRNEMTDLLSDASSLEAAMKRVGRLRELSSVWNGTAEEKARTKFVDSLQTMVEEERAKRPR